MFKKLLGNLPFNPSLISQVAFYARRIRREAFVRRLGVIFVVLGLIVQVFAVVSPPEPTLAESNNDILRGGFSSREQAVNYCRTNTQDFGKILAYYKISCERLATASTATIKSTDHSKQLHSMGRVAQGSVIARTGKQTNEYSVMINGTQYFMRNLWAWDSGSYSSYKALIIKNSDGTTIKILYNCGNIVTIGKYTPPPPPKPTTPEKPPEDVCLNIAGIQTKKEDCDVCINVPGIQKSSDECYPCPETEKDNATTACLEFSKMAANQTKNLANADGTMAVGGDVIKYTLTVKNKGNQTFKAFIMDENLSDVLEYADITDLNGGEIDQNHMVTWAKEDIAPGATIQKTITVRIKEPIAQTPASASDPTSFDLVMSNVFYGNSVQIELPAGVTKSTEILVETLPSTGPGSTILVGFVVTVIASYFFARTRLMAKELDIVRAGFTSSGDF